MSTNTPFPSNKPGYIVSIDGLRALAVGLVVLFHAGFSNFSGGFIGVDVFFVISGFLITTNILKEKETGTFSFTRFYQNRIARLFPALFTVIFLTLLASFFILPPDDLSRLGQAGLYSSISVSNIFFWLESGYFDRASEAKPLLHTWSLSVEEQFYLIWPALLTFFYMLGKRKSVFLGLTFLSVLSLASAIYLYPSKPDAVFFLTPFRVYQFGLGALAALIPITTYKNTRGILAYISAALLIAIALKIDHTSALYFSAIAPTILTSLFIIGATSPLVDKIFSSSPMIWVGKRSYSIYLVHWPLMVLWRLATDYQFSTIEKISSITISVLLGALLHSAVEKRFRFNRSFSPANRGRVIIATMSFLMINVVIASYYWGNDGYPERIPAELRKTTTILSPAWIDRLSKIRDGECSLRIGKYQASDFNKELCLKADENYDSWLILGDSHAAGIYPIFKQAYKDINFNQLTIPGCRLKPTKRIIGDSMCSQLQRFIIGELSEQQHIKGVIISSNWLADHLNEIEEIISEIRAAGKEVILINQRAMFLEKVPNIIFSSGNKKQAFSRAQGALIPENRKIGLSILDRFNGTVTVVDIYKLQCPDSCDIFSESGNTLYLDQSHFSPEGFDLISKRLYETHPNLLSNNNFVN